MSATAAEGEQMPAGSRVAPVYLIGWHTGADYRLTDFGRQQAAALLTAHPRGRAAPAKPG